MGEETETKLSAADRAKAIKDYLDGNKDARAALVKQYPFLSEVFAEINHS